MEDAGTTRGRGPDGRGIDTFFSRSGRKTCSRILGIALGENRDCSILTYTSIDVPERDGRGPRQQLFASYLQSPCQ
jgi:hypothetical protein